MTTSGAARESPEETTAMTPPAPSDRCRRGEQFHQLRQAVDFDGFPHLDFCNLHERQHER
jgi:hypothetical protein